MEDYAQIGLGRAQTETREIIIHPCSVVDGRLNQNPWPWSYELMDEEQGSPRCTGSTTMSMNLHFFLLLPFLRLTLIQLGLGAHLGPSSQTCVYPAVSGFGPSSGVSELAPAYASRCRVPCLRGRKEQSSGMYEQTQQLSHGVTCPPTEFPLFLSRTLPLIRSSLLGS